MMHLRDKGGINCEFQDSCPCGAYGVGQKVSNLTNFGLLLKKKLTWTIFFKPNVLRYKCIMKRPFF
jgi:hypothetical protein